MRSLSPLCALALCCGCSLLYNPDDLASDAGPADTATSETVPDDAQGIEDAGPGDARTLPDVPVSVDSSVDCRVVEVFVQQPEDPSMNGLWAATLTAPALPGYEMTFADSNRYNLQAPAVGSEEGQFEISYEAFRPAGVGPTDTAVLLFSGVGEAACALVNLNVYRAIFRISDVRGSGADADENVESVDIANDGTVVFTSRATNIASAPPRDCGGFSCFDAFLRQVDSESPTLRLAGTVDGRNARNARISGDGLVVAFALMSDEPGKSHHVVWNNGIFSMLPTELRCRTECDTSLFWHGDLRGTTDEYRYAYVDSFPEPDSELLPLALFVADNDETSTLLQGLSAGAFSNVRIHTTGNISFLSTGAPTNGLFVKRPLDSMRTLVDIEGLTLAEDGFRRLIGFDDRIEILDMSEVLWSAEGVRLIDASDDLSVIVAATVSGARMVVYRREVDGDTPEYVEMTTLSWPLLTSGSGERVEINAAAVSPNGRWLVATRVEGTRVIAQRVELQASEL